MSEIEEVGFQGSESSTAKPPYVPKKGVMYMKLGDVGPITNVKVFSIRNGNPADASSLLIRVPILKAFRWRPIHGLNPQDALKMIHSFIRTAYAGIADQDPPGLDERRTRKAAILLGVSRAVITAVHKIKTSDLTPEEVEKPLLGVADENDPLKSLYIMPDLSADMKAALEKPLELTETEEAVIAATHMSAIGILPVQVYSLALTDHHYLSDWKSPSRRAFDLVERQHWKSASVANWFNEDADLIRSILWDKAGHPVKISIKLDLAHDENVPRMLTEAGCGSAASRLPVTEPELHTANLYLMLLQTVRPMYEICGSECGFAPLEDAINVLKLLPRNGPSPDLTGKRPPTVPSTVVTRKLALAHLKTVSEANIDVVAHAYGFFCAFSEQTTTLEDATVRTLKTTFCLTKLKNNYKTYPAFFNGLHFYQDYLYFAKRKGPALPGQEKFLLLGTVERLLGTRL